MRNVFRVFLILISSMFFFNLVYSIPIDCCYDLNTNSLGVCSPYSLSNEISVGLAETQNYPGMSPSGACLGEFGAVNGIVLNNGACIDKIPPQQIVFYSFLDDASKFPEIKSQIDGAGTVVSSCDASSTSQVGGTTSQTTTSGGVDIITSGNTNNGGDYLPETVEETSNWDFQSTCLDVGGYFGFFANSNSCNDYVIGGVNPCLYNPYRAGEVNYYNYFRLKDSFFKDDRFENSCISKEAFNSCDDFRTKENCEVTSENLLGLNCVWEENLEVGGGFCRENRHLDKIFNRFLRYNFNLIQDPSFENLNLNVWRGIDDVNIVVGQENFDGFNAYRLNVGSVISQEIVGVETGLSYEISLVLKNSTRVNLDDLNLEIRVYDVLGNNIDTYVSNVVSLSSFQGVFTKVDFANFVTNKNGVSYVDFILRSNKNDLIVDGISMITSGDKTVSLSDFVFEKVSVMPSSFSNCDVCFTKDGFNTCTKEKSDLLGSCSYLAKNQDISNPYMAPSSLEITGSYSGGEKNIYLNNMGYNWSAQSFPNSKLFCELYTYNDVGEVVDNGGSCENPNNYVNKKFTALHPSAGSTLCRWSEEIGCFKDSNGDGKVDTWGGIEFSEVDNSFRDVMPKLDILKNYDYSSSLYDNYYDAYGDFRNYYFEEVNNVGISDFNLGCDVVPPSSYIYLSAKDSDGNIYYFTNSSEILGEFGSVKIYTKVYDLWLESCEGILPENFERNLFLNVGVNDIFAAPVGSALDFNSNLAGIDLKDFFEGSVNVLDGRVDMNLTFVDSSGNFGKSWLFSFENLDLSGPHIDLVNFNLNSNYEIEGPLFKGDVFEFEILDSSSMISCNLNLEGSNSEFYNTAGVSFNQDDLDGGLIEILISDLIYESSSNGDWYFLNLDCVDAFEQESSFMFYFKVDFQTDVVVIEPSANFEQRIFLSSDSNFLAYSSDVGLASCSFENFPQSGISFSEVVISDIEVGNSLRDDDGFYKNITSYLSFSEDGTYRGNISCVDNNGISFSEEIEFIYDTSSPNLVDFSLVNVESSLNGNITVEVDGNWYSRVARPYLNLTFEGGVYIKDILNVTPILTGGELGNVRYLNDGDWELNTFENSGAFVSNIVLKNYYDPNFYGGQLVSDRNLKNMVFLIYFETSSGVVASREVSFYYDDVAVDFNFSSDVLSVVSGSVGKIFTNVESPNIEFSLVNDDYRLFSCVVSTSDTLTSYSIDFNGVFDSSFSFNLDELIGGTNLDVEAGDVSLRFSCVDIYGVSVSGDYDVVFDNTAPVLSSVYFKGGGDKFISNVNSNGNLVGVEDTLVFNFGGVESEGYICRYSFDGGSNYNCDEDFREVVFSSSGPFEVDLNLVAPEGVSTEDYICYRTEEFESYVKDNAGISSVNSQIGVQVQCRDYVDLSTEVRNVDLNVDYLKSNGLFSLEFEVSEGRVVPIARSLYQYPSLILSHDSLGEDVISSASSTSAEGVFVYRFDELNLDDFEEGVFTLYAMYKSSSEIKDRVSAEIVIDKTKPIVDLEVLGSIDDVVYEGMNIVKLSAREVGVIKSGISEVKFYVNGELKYLINSSSSDYFMNESDLSLVSGGFSGSDLFDVELVLKNLSVGEVLELKLEVMDDFSNVVEVTKTITVIEGVGIILLDSSNAVASVDYVSWITKSSSPIISFRTNKVVDDCSVYPFYDDVWQNVSSNPQINLEKLTSEGGGSEFSFDLSTLGEFDLSRVDDVSVDVKIVCRNGLNYSQHIRKVSFIDFLPDYVLTSESGFVLSKEPFTTTISVKSVGPFPYLSCRYGFDGVNFIDFVEEKRDYFLEEIDFSSYGGVVDLYLQCFDILGTEGPIKKYQFNILKDINLEISNIKLKNQDVEFLENENSILINTGSDLELNFEVNRFGDGLECSYQINPSGNLVLGFMNFFRNIFNIGVEDIFLLDGNNVASASGLNFDSDYNELNLVCMYGDQRVVRELSVEVRKDEFNLLNASLS